MGTPRKFAIRTFGCQMNEHDSERLAGLMVADGMVAVADENEADVVIFNTCTIRENADLKLYSALGQMKALKERRPEMQIAVGGLHGPKGPPPDPRARPLGRRRLWHAQPGRRAAPARTRARARGPLVEVLDAPDPEANRDMAPALYAVRELAFAAWITIQTGCDNTCAYCIVPSVRGGEISRPFDDLVDRGDDARRESGVTEITVARPERQLLRPRHHRSQPPVRRPPARARARSRASSGSASPVRTPRTCVPRRSPRWPRRRRSVHQLHLPLQSGSNRVLRSMRRGYKVERYLDRLARAREAIPTSRSRPT